ncbi:MAG: nitrilase [Deltaproteobacteria bacterium]|nr:nitrilase [Deltaproteobacteria bacterium]
MRDFKVAAVCMQSRFGGMEENLKKSESYVRAAASEGVDMICFPELSLTGYSIKGDLNEYAAESIPGPASDHLVKIADKHGMVILAGMLEKGEGGNIYISQVAVGPSGIIGVHRKTHLSPLERSIYEQGEHVEVFRCEDIAFGMQLCYESHFPELSTIMSLQGSDIIFFSFASPNKNPEEKRVSWLRTLPARAFDNSVFLVACNQMGENGRGLYFPGVIIILGPTGEVLYQYAGYEEKIIVAALKEKDLEETRSNKMRAFMQYRRPELYGKISCLSSDKA